MCSLKKTNAAAHTAFQKSFKQILFKYKHIDELLLIVKEICRADKYISETATFGDELPLSTMYFEVIAMHYLQFRNLDHLKGI